MNYPYSFSRCFTFSQWNLPSTEQRQVFTYCRTLASVINSSSSTNNFTSQPPLNKIPKLIAKSFFIQSSPLLYIFSTIRCDALTAVGFLLTLEVLVDVVRVIIHQDLRANGRKLKKKEWKISKEVSARLKMDIYNIYILLTGILSWELEIMLFFNKDDCFIFRFCLTFRYWWFFLKIFSILK